MVGRSRSANRKKLFVIILSLNHLFGRFGFLKSVATGRTTAIIEATELELNLKVVELLAGTSLAVVPRVMERIWQCILNEGPQWRIMGAARSARPKKRTGAYLNDDEIRQFDELRAMLKNVVSKNLWAAGSSIFPMVAPPCRRG